MKIFIWNVGKAAILTTIDCHPEVILSVSWNYNGSRIVTSCKDKIFRVINPRTGNVMKVRFDATSSLLGKLLIPSSQEWAIKAPSRRARSTCATVASFRRASRECLRDNTHFGTGFVRIGDGKTA